MTPTPTRCCLKVDVDTHDGMRDGVPRLLDAFKAAGVRATFFLSFGPDNAGKAIWNVFRTKGFLRKMMKTGAPKLYGWRTVLSGTLLPARPIATAFPDLARRIEAEGHEAGVHAWDHRLWQDHLAGLTPERIAGQYALSFEAFERVLGRRADSAAAPAWCATAASWRAQDTLKLRYASDCRGGEPCFPVLDGYRSATLQIPTTQPCLEELLTLGERDLDLCADKVLAIAPGTRMPVLPLHAEVEGGVYRPFLEILLRKMRERGMTTLTLREAADELLTAPTPPPVRNMRAATLPGRAGFVIAPAA